MKRLKFAIALSIAIITMATSSLATTAVTADYRGGSVTVKSSRIIPYSLIYVSFDRPFTGKPTVYIRAKSSAGCTVKYIVSRVGAKGFWLTVRYYGKSPMWYRVEWTARRTLTATVK